MQTLPWQREDRDVAAGTLCDVAGWGVVSHTGRKPDRLQYLALPVLGRATCNLRKYHDGTVTERMMCTESNRRDTCKVRGGAGSAKGAELRAGKVRPGWVEPALVGGAWGDGSQREQTGARGRTDTSAAELQGNTGGQGGPAEGHQPSRACSTQGDSGSPLVCGGVAEGIVTSGSRVCGNPKKPGIYTRLASYAAWIDGVLAGAQAA